MCCAQKTYSGRLGNRITNDRTGKRRSFKPTADCYRRDVWYNVSWDDNSRNQIRLQRSTCTLAPSEQQQQALLDSAPGCWCIDADSLLNAYREQFRRISLLGSASAAASSRAQAGASSSQASNPIALVQPATQVSVAEALRRVEGVAGGGHRTGSSASTHPGAHETGVGQEEQRAQGERADAVLCVGEQRAQGERADAAATTAGSIDCEDALRARFPARYTAAWQGLEENDLVICNTFYQTANELHIQRYSTTSHAHICGQELLKCAFSLQNVVAVDVLLSRDKEAGGVGACGVAVNFSRVGSAYHSRKSCRKCRQVMCKCTSQSLFKDVRDRTLKRPRDVATAVAQICTPTQSVKREVPPGYVDVSGEHPHKPQKRWRE
jgi:hypothetical protein